MCELLVWTTPRNISGNGHPGSPDRGTVVTVKPDGHRWGLKEIGNPLFRVVKMPGVEVSDMLHLTQAIRADDGTMLERSRYIVPLDLLEKGKAVAPGEAIAETAEKLLVGRVERIVSDPRVIR